MATFNAADALAAQKQLQALGHHQAMFETQLSAVASTSVPSPCERFAVVDGVIQVSMLGVELTAKARPIADSQGAFTRVEYPFMLRDGDID